MMVMTMVMIVIMIMTIVIVVMTMAMLTILMMMKMMASAVRFESSRLLEVQLFAHAIPSYCRMISTRINHGVQAGLSHPVSMPSCPTQTYPPPTCPSRAHSRRRSEANYTKAVNQ